MKMEKSPVRASDRAGVFLSKLVPLVLIVISIACSVSKSASSPTSNQPVSPPASPSPSTSVAERAACTLKISEAPVISRLRLGMTADEILALFPGSKQDAELSSALSKRGPLGNATVPLIPSKYGAADFKDVNRITFNLLDGRVSSLTLNYNGPQWPHIDKFVEKFVADKDLPKADQWEPYAGMDDQMKTLTCTGFSIRIFSGGEGGSQNYVLLEDVEADKTLKERRKKAREKASQTPG